MFGLVTAKMFLHAKIKQKLRETISQLIQSHESVTIAKVREVLDPSRKLIAPVGHAHCSVPVQGYDKIGDTYDAKY